MNEHGDRDRSEPPTPTRRFHTGGYIAAPGGVSPTLRLQHLGHTLDGLPVVSLNGGDPETLIPADRLRRIDLEQLGTEVSALLRDRLGDPGTISDEPAGDRFVWQEGDPGDALLSVEDAAALSALAGALDTTPAQLATGGFTGTDGNRRSQAGGYRCCKHCAEDDVHDIPAEGHEGPCQTCDSPNALLLERVVEAEAKVARVEAMAEEWLSEFGPASELENVMGQQSVTIATAVRLIRAALAGPEPDTTPRRFDQCDATCTTDCGHCKGAGRPEAGA
jgi:hypothetical protein